VEHQPAGELLVHRLLGALLVDQHRIRPPELDHTRRDLIDLPSLWVRGLRSYGRKRSIGHSSIRPASATSPASFGASVNCDMVPSGLRMDGPGSR
jgi:hypothetical protein